MSKTLDLHSGLAVIATIPGYGIIQAASTAAPTASAAGFANGCIYQKLGGSADQNVYINEGTSASASWVVLPTP